MCSSKNDDFSEHGDFERYNQPSPRLLELAASSASKGARVLDVGCWGGALGRELKKAFDCRVDGIDINAEALDVAVSNGYEQVFYLDLNTDSLERLENQKYKVIVLGDVLEHTMDADSVLKKLLPKLQPDGFLVISLPNIGFVWFRLLHLAGIWEYKSSGVMDRTHLRFFTYKSMWKFFEANNLQVLEVRPYIGIKNRTWPVRKIMRVLAVAWPGLFALQVVFKLRPRPSN